MNAPTVQKPLRRHPLAHLEIIDEHVSDMLRNDVIEPAALRRCGPSWTGKNRGT